MAARRSSRKRVSRKRRTVRRRSRKRMSRRRVSKKRRVTKRKVVRRKARKARKPTIRGSKYQVFKGSKLKTKTSGQTKGMLMKNKRGKIVSKKSHANGKRVYKQNGLAKWTKAFMKARKNLGIKGFVACKKGTKFYKEAMRLYKA